MNNQINMGNTAVSNRFSLVRITGILLVVIGLEQLYSGTTVLLSPLHYIASRLTKIGVSELVFGVLYVACGVMVYKHKWLKSAMVVQIFFIVTFYYLRGIKTPSIEMLLSAIFFVILAFQLKNFKLN